VNLAVFFAELERRRVFRVAAAYAVVAFVVAQVADIFLPGLGLPEWSLRLVLALLILGFPVALVLAWAFDITPDGVVRTGEAPPAPAAVPTSAAEQPVATPPSPATVPPGGRAARWLGVGILVALVAAGAYSGVQGRWRPAPVDGVSLTAVAVFPFSVRGSAESEYLGEGMVDLLSAKLDGAGALRSVDPRALLSYLARDGGSAADPEKGRAVAEHFGAGLYILGNILEAGGRLQLSASLYSQERGASRVTSARVEGEAERIWELVDQLAAQLLAEQVGRGERLTRLAATTTESFPALRAYLEGESTLRVGNFPAAIDAFQRAVAADSTFALAHYRLAVSATWAWNEVLARRAIERAVRYAERLSERDRRLVTALQMFNQGRAAEAEPIYRSLVASYPDDVEAWYQLGEVVIHYNPFRGRSWQEAWEPFARAVELQPNHELSLSHLIPLAVVAGRQAEAESLLETLDPDGGFYPLWEAFVGLFGDETARFRALPILGNAPAPELQVLIWLALDAPGHHPRAREVAQLLTDRSRPAPERAAGHLVLAQIELGQGRPRAAAEELRRADDLDSAAALEMRALLALAPFVPPARPELEALRAELEGWDATAPASADPPLPAREAVRPQLRLYLLGLLNARLGEEAAAQRHAAELERLDGPPGVGSLIPDLALAVRAEVARARGDAAGALVLLEHARLEIPVYIAVGSPFLFQDRERFLRGELLSQAGRHEEAIGWYTAVTETSTTYNPVAHLRLGEIHDRLGNRVRAAEHYARFVALWEECDPELRPLREGAERRLAALHGGGG
jgi:tetratricopeptide (TPR) repeat protein